MPTLRNIALTFGVGDIVSTPEQITANSSTSSQPATASASSSELNGDTSGGRKRGGKPVWSESTAGILFGIGAYSLWGLLPLYFLALQPAGAIEIVANRVVWSLIFCALLITVTRAWRVFGAAVKDRTVFGPLALAAGLIAINWLTYTFGVTTGHAVETSLDTSSTRWCRSCSAYSCSRRSCVHSSGPQWALVLLPWAC